jgi:AmiR/NasT family two-component response regulator
MNPNTEKVDQTTVNPSSQNSAGAASVSYRCMIVEDETLVGLHVQSELQRLGHVVVGQAANSQQGEEIFRTQKPDLVLSDIRLGSDDGLDLSDRLLKIRPCPIIIISAYGDKELISRAINVGVFGYLVKPVTGTALAAQIEVSVARFREHMVLVAEKHALTQSLENRKLLERAKGVLMQRLNLSEPDAHRRLQQESQKRRTNIVELAKKIIESEELLGGL